jgi:hypothetical protein
MRITQIIASAAIRNENPIRSVAAPTDLAVPLLRSKHPLRFSATANRSPSNPARVTGGLGFDFSDTTKKWRPVLALCKGGYDAAESVGACA